MAYRNGCGKRRLLVFAVDERRRVYWYHPAWTDGSARPRAINISAQPGLHELPEAVAHRFAGRRITVYGVFTDEPLAVTRVEQLVGALGAPGDKLPLAHAVQRMIVLRLRPRSVRP